MANMTIENIGGVLSSGNIERITDRGQAIDGPIPPGNQSAVEGQGVGPATQSFGEMLNTSVEKLNDLQNQADRAAKEMVAGRNKNIHETMLMMEKADMSFKLAMQVRNKIIDAYREIMRMQV